MSGICGIVYPHGREVEERAIAAVLKRMEQRGPDGSHVWCDGPVGLGHALLATAPQAETMPWKHDGNGCTITADARLDNREELIESLGLSTGVGDGTAILHAYLKWGSACVEHLRGDFAFAIWDPREQRLFCARDQVGMRQLIWHYQEGRFFTFATDAVALLALPEAALELLESRVGDYFEGLEAYDLTSTFFADVYKLPPAHALTFDAGGVRVWRYWSAKVPEALHLPCDAAYAEAFREVFTQAIEVRLRANGPVGSMLSGGMDSGSVSAVAARLLQQSDGPPLQTFSALRADTNCIESNAIRAALGIEHIDPTLVSLEEFNAYADDLITLAQRLGEPFDGPMVLPRAVYLAAHRAGVKVMLDGVGGDTTLASEPMVPWYFEQRKWLAAFREARGERHYWGSGADSWSTQARRLLSTLAPRSWIERRHVRYHEQQLELAAGTSPLEPDFARAIDMPQRRQGHAAHIAPPTDPHDRRLHRVLHPHIVIARERYDRTAAALGIEARDPFLDLRVIEFCLSLPQEQLQHRGWPKIILRRAMAGLLPDAVRWRMGKEHLGECFSDQYWRLATKRSTPDFAALSDRYLKSNAITSGGTPGVTSVRIAHERDLHYLGLWMKSAKSCKDEDS